MTIIFGMSPRAEYHAVDAGREPWPKSLCGRVKVADMHGLTAEVQVLGCADCAAALKGVDTTTTGA